MHLMFNCFIPPLLNAIESISQITLVRSNNIYLQYLVNWEAQAECQIQKFQFHSVSLRFVENQPPHEQDKPTDQPAMQETISFNYSIHRADQTCD